MELHEVNPGRIDAPDKGKHSRTDDSEVEGDGSADGPASKRSKSDKLTIHERYNDESASLKFISSDNVVFYIDRAFATVHSRVFKDMLEVGNGSEIQLTDTTLETASVLVILLDLWHGSEILDPNESAPFWGRAMADVMDLVKKYDCPGTASTIRSAYRASLCDEDHSPIKVFLTLAVLEDIQGCATAIRVAATKKSGAEVRKRR